MIQAVLIPVAPNNIIRYINVIYAIYACSTKRKYISMRRYICFTGLKTLSLLLCDIFYIFCNLA